MERKPETFEIEGPAAYKAAIETLNKRGRAPSILRMIMNALESYRQARKLGWSRPWNKYGVRTFRSYRLDFSRDEGLIETACSVLATQSESVPTAAQAFVDDLLSDDPDNRMQLMGFIFYHEIEDDTGVHEGMTLSFGRKNAKRHRDRFDLVFDAPVKNGTVGSLSRLRIYVDPFEAVGPPLWQCTVNADGGRRLINYWASMAPGPTFQNAPGIIGLPPILITLDRDAISPKIRTSQLMGLRPRP